MSPLWGLHPTVPSACHAFPLDLPSAGSSHPSGLSLRLAGACQTPLPAPISPRPSLTAPPHGESLCMPPDIFLGYYCLSLPLKHKLWDHRDLVYLDYHCPPSIQRSARHRVGPLSEYSLKEPMPLCSGLQASARSPHSVPTQLCQESPLILRWVGQRAAAFPMSAWQAAVDGNSGSAPGFAPCKGSLWRW